MAHCSAMHLCWTIGPLLYGQEIGPTGACTLYSMGASTLMYQNAKSGNDM